MTTFYENIALFTSPAVKSSRQLFRGYWIYIFSDTEESNFNEEIYSEATHIWLGEKFLAEGDENTSWKYVKISVIWEIAETGSFSVDFEEWKLKAITYLESKLLSKEIMFKYMEKFMEGSMFYTKNETISPRAHKNWRFIYAKMDSLISISENILYPSKNTVSFPLNIDKNGKYLEAKNFINTLKISENVYLDRKDKNLLVKNFSENIKKWEVLLENNLKKVPFWDTNNELYINIMKILHKNPNGFKIREYNEFKEILDTDFGEKIKAFNRGGFADYLDFTLVVTSSLFIHKKQK